jgi:nucleotide-binding universal stress UspA family protein
MMKILIGLDGSSRSLDAVRLVGRLVDPRVDEVDFYFSPVEMERRLPAAQRGLVDGVAKALRAEAASRLPETMPRPPRLMTTPKAPAVGLLDAAAEGHADLVVVGARGHGAIEGFLLGSVSRAVVHGTTLPVLVARMPPPTERPLRVLVGHRPASASSIATLLGRLHWPDDTDGRVIGVAESLLAGPLPPWLEQRARDPDTAAIADAWKHEHDEEVEDLRRRLAAFEADLPAVFRRRPPFVEQGNPGDKILERSRVDGIDLIVVGRTPSDAVTRWLVGSTSEALLTSAHSSVLIVPVARS